MSDLLWENGDRGEPESASSTFSVVLQKELRDLWIGGKALNLTIAYTVLLGAYAYWMARDSGLSLIPPKEMVFELLKVAMIVSVFMGVIVGADTISGERERSTLEGLLLTPSSRGQIVAAKFFAALSTWPVAMLVTVPYLKVLSQGDEVFRQALQWGAIVSTMLVPAFVALAMLVSFWSATNKTSMFVNIGIYLVFLLPTQLPGHAQGGFMGLLFQALNPMAGTRHFIAGMLVNNRTFAGMWTFLVSSVVFEVFVLGLLFLYAGPALRLEAGREKKVRFAGAGVAVALLVASLVGVLGAAPAWALQEAQAPAPQAAAEPIPLAQTPLQISIDKSDTVVRAGLPVPFKTVVTNSASEASGPVIVAMNIINLNAKGDIVDPEDWSPQRTQYVAALAPGQSTSLDWRVNAIIDGDYMIYMVAIPAPVGADATSQPVASSGIHLTVTPYTKLNPGGVLPYALGGPLLLGLVISFVYRRRRRQIDLGG